MPSINEILSEAVSATRVRIAAAEKANADSVRGTDFKPTGVGDGVVEKFLRNEIEARKDALFEAAVAEAAGEL